MSPPIIYLKPEAGVWCFEGPNEKKKKKQWEKETKLAGEERLRKRRDIQRKGANVKQRRKEKKRSDLQTFLSFFVITVTFSRSPSENMGRKKKRNDCLQKKQKEERDLAERTLLASASGVQIEGLQEVDRRESKGCYENQKKEIVQLWKMPVYLTHLNHRQDLLHPGQSPPISYERTGRSSQKFIVKKRNHAGLI